MSTNVVFTPCITVCSLNHSACEFMVCRVDSSSQLQVIPILDYAWDLYFKKDKELLKSIQLLATHMAAKSWHGRPNQYTISHHSHKVENIYMGFIIIFFMLYSIPRNHHCKYMKQPHAKTVSYFL